ncbi:hypothetical protein M3Y98_00712500 [Aphelenchoides besseyi]|nr:hypothetical protein M3Y98_00712500 [Aphelenchoides besseyi]
MLNESGLDAIFDFATVPILITAKDCGVRRNDCLWMCNDEELAHVYCDPLCFPINDAMYYAHCRTLTFSTSSSTYKRLNGSWKERLQCCKDPSMAVSLPRGFNLVVPDENVIFGLGFQDSSGHVGVVEQLYQHKRIDHFIFRPIGYFGRIPGPIFPSSLMLLDGHSSGTSGVVWSRDHEFAGFREMYDKLVGLGIVLDHCSIPGLLWCVRNDTEKTFVVHGHDYSYRIEIPPDSHCVKHNNQTFCHAETKNLQYSRSNGPNSWVIPFALTRYFQPFCYALDYAKRAVAIGISLALKTSVSKSQ